MDVSVTDVSAMDISATENLNDGRFGHVHILCAENSSIHAYTHACVMPYLRLTVYIFLLLEALGYEKCNLREPNVCMWLKKCM